MEEAALMDASLQLGIGALSYIRSHIIMCSCLPAFKDSMVIGRRTKSGGDDDAGDNSIGSMRMM